MAKKTKSLFNAKLKAFFEEEKRQSGTTSKQLAEALGVSQQTVTSMSGKLDKCSVHDVAIIAKTMCIPVERFIVSILINSDLPGNGYNGTN